MIILTDQNLSSKIRYIEKSILWDFEIQTGPFGVVTNVLDYEIEVSSNLGYALYLWVKLHRVGEEITLVWPLGGPSSRQYLLSRSELIAGCLGYFEGINHFMRRSRLSFDSCVLPTA